MKMKLSPILVLAVLLLTGTAYSYTTIGDWPGEATTMRASSVTFPSGNAYRTSLGTVVSHFNRNPSDFRFTQTYDDTSVSKGNGQNEVWGSDSTDCSPAVTFYWLDGSGNMVEADVCIYAGEPWTTSMTKTSSFAYGGSSRTFETTVMHEYGHAAGLGHEADEYNLMGQDWTHVHCNGTTLTSYVGEDAASGLISLYGKKTGATIEDVSATLFKRTGASGEYSTHGFCKIYNTSGVELSSDSYNGQRRYTVTKGQKYRVEFTYENNGETSPQNPKVRFYTSTNSTITTADTTVTTKTPELARGNVYTHYYEITIPSSLTSGTTYYLGVIVDYNNVISENDGANAAYHIIKVQ